MENQEEIRTWLRTTPECDPGMRLVRSLQAELNDLRRMFLREPVPRSPAEDFIRRTSHRDFS